MEREGLHALSITSVEQRGESAPIERERESGESGERKSLLARERECVYMCRSTKAVRRSERKRSRERERARKEGARFLSLAISIGKH